MTDPLMARFERLRPQRQRRALVRVQQGHAAVAALQLGGPRQLELQERLLARPIHRAEGRHAQQPRLALHARYVHAAGWATVALDAAVILTPPRIFH